LINLAGEWKLSLRCPLCCETGAFCSIGAEYYQAFAESCQQAEGGVPSPLLSTGKATPGVTGPVLVSPVQETC